GPGPLPASPGDTRSRPAPAGPLFCCRGGARLVSSALPHRILSAVSVVRPCAP
ncbi:hypothetical protein HGM15179_011323, partial [Zosterops borbonicus]